MVYDIKHKTNRQEKNLIVYFPNNHLANQSQRRYVMKNKDETPEAEFIAVGEITDKFRITIPKKVRDALGLKKENIDFVAFYIDKEDEIVLLRFLKIQS